MHVAGDESAGADDRSIDFRANRRFYVDMNHFATLSTAGAIDVADRDLQTSPSVSGVSCAFM